MIRGRTIIYPALTDPVLTAAQRPEQVTESRWHQPLAEPVRRRVPVPAFPAICEPSWVPTPVPPPKVDGWMRQLSEPVRRKVPVPEFPATFLHPFPITVANYQWLMPLSEPVRRRGMATFHQDELFFVGSDPARDKYWYRPLSEPTRTRRVTDVAQAFVYAPAAAETITLDKWYQPFSDPTRRKPTIQPDAASFVYNVYFTGDGSILYASTNVIVPWSKTLQYPAIAAPVPLTPEYVNWYRPLSEPTRRKVPVPQQREQFFDPFPLTVANYQWLTPLSEPVRRRAMPTHHQDELFFVGSDTSRDHRWWMPLSEPVRTRRVTDTPSPLVYAPVVAEVVTMDKWYRPLSDAPRRIVDRQTAGASFVYNIYFTGPGGVNPDKYWQPFSEPVRRKVERQTAGASFVYGVAFTGDGSVLYPSTNTTIIFSKTIIYQAVADAIQFNFEVVTADKWLTPLSDPTRRRGMPVFEQPFQSWSGFTPAETDLRWYRPLSEPTRRRVPVPEYAATFLHPFPLTVANYQWLMPLSEPVRRRGINPTVQDELFFIGSDTSRDHRWFVPLSEPVRRRGINATVQDELFFIGSDTARDRYWYPPLAEPVRTRLRPPVFPAVFLDPNPVTVAAYLWQQPLSLPIPPRRVVEFPFAAWSYYTPSNEIVTLDKWYGALSVPTRRIVDRQTAGLSFVYNIYFTGPGGVNPDKYWQPLSLPIRARPIVEFPSTFWSYFTPTPTQATAFDWRIRAIRRHRRS